MQRALTLLVRHTTHTKILRCLVLQALLLLLSTEAPSISNQRILESDMPKILDKLRPHSDKWLDIGDALGFKTYELANIQATPTLLASAPYMYLRELLSQWVNWAPGDARGSRDFATWDMLRRALEKAGLETLVHELLLQ